MVAVTLLVANYHRLQRSTDNDDDDDEVWKLEVRSRKVTIFRVETTTTLGPPVDE